jgi:hypothetical protein
MPITHKIDVGRRIVLTRAFGIVTDSELFEYHTNLPSDPDFDPSFNLLSDFTEVTKWDVQSRTVHRIASIRLFGDSSLRAIVASSDVIFGHVRMFLTLRDIDPKNLRVFRDLNEARKWLGLDKI